jgi:hypothetical protein
MVAFNIKSTLQAIILCTVCKEYMTACFPHEAHYHALYALSLV